MNYLRGGTPSAEPYDPIARVYENAKGVDEIIHLHRCYWDYVDWLEATTDIKFADYLEYKFKDDLTVFSADFVHSYGPFYFKASANTESLKSYELGFIIRH